MKPILTRIEEVVSLKVMAQPSEVFELLILAQHHIRNQANIIEDLLIKIEELKEIR